MVFIYLLGKMPQTSIKLRQKIIKLDSQNLSICEISRITGVHKATVSRTIIRYNERGTLQNRKSPGRPRKITEKVERLVTRSSKKYPFFNASQLRKTEKFSIAASCIRKILVKYGLRARITVKKPSIRQVNREKRQIWAKKMLSEKTKNFWKTVVFSDETTLDLDWGGRGLVRRPKNKRYDLKYMVKRNVFCRKKLMVWGCIRSNGERLLVKIENNVNSDEYIKILKENVLDFLYMHEPFQQDNAPAHKSLKTKNFFWENGFTILENWPPQSPDINIIENMWSILKKRVCARQPETLKALWGYAQEEFGKIPCDYVEKLYSSIPRRLELVLKRKGYPTKY